MAESRSGDGAGGPLGQLREAAGRNPITERLYEAGEQYVKAKAEDLVSSAANKLGSTSQRLNDLAEQGGKAGMAVKGGEALAEGKSPLGAAFSAVGSELKNKVKGVFGKGRGKGSGGKKVINIIEDIDVGVPLREAYDQWTQFQEFSSFTKGVVSADKGDDVTSTWKFKVFWSNRSMTAKIDEQIPDERISWSCDGAKGTIKGVVTFHSLGPTLTKVLLVIEYYPAGLFEKTGNIWRAQGRRARLDLKHYRRFIMMRGEATDGWRGEIRDGEVVRSHEEALEAEEAEREPDEQDEHEDAEDQQEHDEDYDEAGDESDDESGEDEDQDEDYEDEDADDEYEDDDDFEDEGDYEDAEDADDDEDYEDEEDDEDTYEPEDEDEDEEEQPRRRQRVGSAR